MALDRLVQSIADQMEVAAAIATAVEQARAQKDYATAASLLAILHEMPMRGMVAVAAPQFAYRTPAPSGYHY